MEGISNSLKINSHTTGSITSDANCYKKLNVKERCKQSFFALDIEEHTHLEVFSSFILLTLIFRGLQLGFKFFYNYLFPANNEEVVNSKAFKYDCKAQE